MTANSSPRAPTTATQKGVNQFVIATPVASLFGLWLGQYYPPEVVAPATAIVMAVVTTGGNVLRNIASERGWTRYIG